jgi:hypothetical protein
MSMLGSVTGAHDTVQIVYGRSGLLFLTLLAYRILAVVLLHLFPSLAPANSSVVDFIARHFVTVQYLPKRVD